MAIQNVFFRFESILQEIIKQMIVLKYIFNE